MQTPEDYQFCNASVTLTRFTANENRRAMIMSSLKRVATLGFSMLAAVLSPLLITSTLVAQTPSETPLISRTQSRWNLRVVNTVDGEKPIDTASDWDQRRAILLSAMQNVMGPFPKDDRRGEMAVKVIAVESIDELLRIELTYENEPGCDVPAFLFVPQSVAAHLPFAEQLKALVPLPEAEEQIVRLPAMLCLHPTEDVLGHRVVIGIPERPTMGYALELAQRGYITCAPAYPLLANYQPDLVGLGWRSGSMKAVWDNSRALDLLSTFPFVDAERMGTIGHSLGGHNSVYSAVFDPRLKVIVSSCGLDAYVDYYGGREDLWAFGQGWCQSRYIPDLSRFQGSLETIPYDFPEMIASLAPRHMLIVAPVGDDNFRAESVDRIAESASEVYELFDAREHLKVLHPPGPHDFSDEMRQAAYEWIDAALKN